MAGEGTVWLRLVGSVHHGGLLYNRIEQGGLVVVSRRIELDEFEVRGSDAAVAKVIASWDGEGTVERLD